MFASNIFNALHSLNIFNYNWRANKCILLTPWLFLNIVIPSRAKTLKLPEVNWTRGRTRVFKFSSFQVLFSFYELCTFKKFLTRNNPKGLQELVKLSGKNQTKDWLMIWWLMKDEILYLSCLVYWGSRSQKVSSYFANK